MSIVLTGSLAYDHIMVFPGRFSEHILPEKTHILNVSFTVSSCDRYFGGNAGNIAYNLALLGIKPLIVATAGRDFGGYKKHLRAQGISCRGIKVFPDSLTAQAFITTDLADNQITAFYPGALEMAAQHGLDQMKRKPWMTVISPNHPVAFMAHVRHCTKNSWPYLFDPAQIIPVLSKAELIEGISGAEGMIVNDYEWQMIQEKTGLNISSVLTSLKYLIITLGERGADVYTGAEKHHVPAVPGIKVIDPTGAGDAFRAGFLYGLSLGRDLAASCKIACSVASFAVEKRGTQEHLFSLEKVGVRSLL